MGVGLLERRGERLLRRRGTAEADARVGGAHGRDEIVVADQPADAPAGAVEVLAAGADGESVFGDLRGEGEDAGELGVVEAVVDFVREEDQAVLDAEVADGEEFLPREDLADGVVWGVDDDHARARGDGCLELGHIDVPFGGAGGLLVPFFWRMHGHVNDLAAAHLDVGDVLVEEGLEYYDLVALVEETHERSEHAFVGARRDGDFGLRVDGVVEGAGIGVCNSLSQTGSAFGMGVLVVGDFVVGVFGGLDDEGRGVVAEEALAHVHNGLFRTRCGGFVDDGPDVFALGSDAG